MSNFLVWLLGGVFLFGQVEAARAADGGELNEEEKALLKTYGDEEMISIATGVKQSIRKAPAVTTVITAEDIKAIGATDIDEVLETVPGLHVVRNSVGYNPIYSFRGINSAWNQQVLVLVNGIPITHAYIGDRSVIWGGMPVQAIARIEVVRGPGSAVYGADAAAGVINIITKTKQDINGSEIGGRVGSFDTYDGWALHGSEWAGFDVAAMVEYRDTAGAKPIIDSDLQSQLDGALGTQASLAPGPVNLSRENLDLRLDVSRGNWRWRGGLQRRRNLGLGAGMAQALAPDSHYAADRWNADLTYHNPQFTDNWDVQAQLSYFDTANTPETNNRLLPPGTLLPIGANGQIDFASPLGLVTFPDGYIGNPSTFERHARSGLAGTYTGFENHVLRLGGGFNYSTLWASATENFGLDPATGQPIPLSGPPRLVSSTGTSEIYIKNHDRQNGYFYLQDEWKFANDWAFTGGMRYDTYSDFGDTVNPRMALVWETRYDLTSKLMYGTAFRAPSFSELYAVNNPVSLGNPKLRPEIMDTMELAFDYRPRDNLRFGWNIFNYWWKDLIHYQPDADGGSYTAQNSGSQTGYGTELETEWKATDKLKLIGHYAFQKSQDEALNHDAGYSPHHQVYLRANWEFLPNWHFSPQAKWIVGRGRVDGDVRPAVADYTWVDMTLRRKQLADHWEVAFSIRNLFDVNAREPSLAGQPIAPIRNDLPLAGRSFFGEIRFDF
jgi:iron complex outermembrane receptor protein